VPYQLEFGEGNVLASSLRVAQGESAYPPLTTQPPYVISPYGPLLYWIEAPLVRWFGVGFGAGRLLSLLATFASGALLVLLLHLWTGSWRIALMFGALYPCLPQVRLWAATMRADPLAVALSLAGLYVVAAGEKTRRRPLPAVLFLAVVFFLGAILLKPTLVAAPAAVFLSMVVRKERKAAFGFAAAMVAGIVIAFFWMQHATAGAFLVHLFGSHPEPYTLRHYLRVAAMVVREQAIPSVMLVAFVAVSVKRRGAIWTPALPLLYIAMALLSTFSAGMAGASANHFMAWGAAVCIGAGMAYQLAKESASRFARTLGSVALLAMVASALAFSTLSWMLWDDTSTTEGPLQALAKWVPYQQRIFPIDTEVPRDCIELQEYLASLPGESVISENTGAALLAGKTLLITDPYTYGQLVLAGKLPPAPLEQMLRDHRVGAVVLAYDVARLRTDSSNRWPASFLDAVEKNYQWERTFKCKDGGAVYVPRVAP
jgi:4-amino-4-deoxy-L-arabinose transferase-like glycosyltransferase